MGLIEVSRTEFTTVTMDPKGPLVRSVRSEIPFATLEALEQSVAHTARIYDDLGRSSRVLLSDLRAIPGRNDGIFEERMKKLRPKLYSGFRRVGLLVRSSVGALQIRRMIQEDGIARMVATDEAALLEYLLKE